MLVTVEQRQQPLHNPALGPNGEPCQGCGYPLANDQRYCLECGRRRSDARVDFIELLEARLRKQIQPAGGGGAQEPPGTTGNAYPWWSSPVAPIGAAVALFALVLGVGILIGNDGGEPKQAAAPQVITVPSATPAAAPVEAEFVSDWPEGQEGFTIQLQTLPKEGTQASALDAAKTGATGKGAPEVGVLDSDNFASLDPGNYVLYSGVFETRKEAKASLKDVQAQFPDAEVVEVSSGAGAGSTSDQDLTSGKKESGTASDQQLQDLQRLSPDEYQKKSQKLPDETATEGKPPPKDNKRPGGDDGGAEVIE